MAFIPVLLLLIVVFCLSVASIIFNNMNWDKISLINVATSQYITPSQLLFMRLIYTLINIGVTLFIMNDKPLNLSVLKDGQIKKFTLYGFERFSAFTLWCWLLQGIYFVLVTFCSNDYLTNINSTYLSHKIICATNILFEINFATAFLVTVVVTFVLIPTGKAKGISVDPFFRIPALCAHNLNVLFMLSEALLSNMKFSLLHIPFVLLYGCAYVVFAWYWNQVKGVFLYFFLDYQRDYAVLWHIGLLVAIGLFSLFGCLVSYIKETNALPQMMGLIFGTLFILKLRE